MPSDEFYTAGAESALTNLRLVKVGFMWGAAARGLASAGKGLLGGARSAASGIASGAGKAVSKPMAAYGKHVTQPLQRAGTGAEKWMGQQAGQLLSPKATVATRKLIKGVPAYALRQGVGFGAIGAGVGGATGAMSAEPGSRLQGALSGAGTGALGWGAMGLGGSAAGRLTKNVGRIGLSRTARSQGLPWNAKQVGQQMDQGWLKNVKGIGTGAGPMGRKGSAIAAATGTGALGADVYTSLKIDEALQGKRPPQAPGQQAPAPQYPAQAPDHAYIQQYAPPRYRTVTAAAGLDMSPVQQLNEAKQTIPSAYLGSAIGGTVAGLGTAAMVHALRTKKMIPATGVGALAAQIAPSIAGSTGGLVGYSMGHNLDPSERDMQLKKLDTIDLNKLMRYYKKQPAL